MGFGNYRLKHFEEREHLENVKNAAIELLSQINKADADLTSWSNARIWNYDLVQGLENLVGKSNVMLQLNKTDLP